MREYPIGISTANIDSMQIEARIEIFVSVRVSVSSISLWGSRCRPLN